MTQRATADQIREWDRRAEDMKRRIREARDETHITGKTYYVSAEGDDGCDGLTPRTAWRSTEKVSRAALAPGDGVLFRRGDVFRGQITCREGVTYGAWGEGAKPAIYGWEKDLADENMWSLFDGEKHIYRLNERIPDCGTLVFDGGKRHSRKLIPSYIGGRFVRRDEPNVDFDLREDMTEDLDLFCDCRSVMTGAPSHGETWPVPDMRGGNVGDLYLRCDGGNPGSVFRSIEALPGRHLMAVGSANGVHIDNLCLMYCGAHAVSAGGACVKDLRVTNCEIGWVGGTVQHYFGTDPNYPQGTRGSVTRYGNGIEIYGGCDSFYCGNNYIYQVYDAGITHQYTVPRGGACNMKNVRYTGNLIEYCVYSIEYFLSNTQGTDSVMDGVEIDHNVLRFSGYGWGQQRHNIWTPAHIKGWTFENPARHYSIHHNVFDRAKYRLLHLCCLSPESYPAVDGNVYIQHLGRPLGQFGACRDGAPQVVAFMETADEDIQAMAQDHHARAYYTDGV